MANRKEAQRILPVPAWRHNPMAAYSTSGLAGKYGPNAEKSIETHWQGRLFKSSTADRRFHLKVPNDSNLTGDQVAKRRQLIEK